MARTKGTVNKSTEQNAEALWDVLWTYDRAGITKKQACTELDISPQSFTSALKHLKLEFQVENKAPITCDPITHRYVINPSVTEAKDYSEWIVKRLLGQTESQKILFAAMKTKFGDSRDIRRMVRYSEDIIDTLEEMLES